MEMNKKLNVAVAVGDGFGVVAVVATVGVGDVVVPSRSAALIPG